MDGDDARRYANSSHNPGYSRSSETRSNENFSWSQQHSESSHFSGNQIYDTNIATVADPIAAEVGAMSSQAIESAIENSENVVSTLLSQDT